MENTFIKAVINFFKRRDIAELFFLTIALSLSLVYTSVINYKAEWSAGDDNEFLITTAIGKPEPLSTHGLTSSGRFYPLAHYEFNILTLLPKYGRTAQAHYILVSIEFLATIALTVFMLIKLQKNSYDLGLEVRPYLGALFLLVFATTKCFLWIYLSIFYPERLLLFLFAMFVIFYYLALENDRKIFYVPAFIIVFLASYVKEPVSIMFACMAALSFLLGNKKLKRADIAFNLALILNAILFLVLYYFLSYRHIIATYTPLTPAQNILKDVLDLLLWEKIIGLVFISSIIRIYFIAKGDRKHLFQDTLLFSASAYACAYFILKMPAAYYYAPAVYLSFIPLAYWVLYFFKNGMNKAFAAAVCISVFLILGNLSSLNEMYAFNLGNRISTPALMQGIAKDIKNNQKYFFIANPQIKHQARAFINNYINYLLGTERQIYIEEITTIDQAPKNSTFIYQLYIDGQDKILKELNENKKLKQVLLTNNLIFYRKI